MPSHANVFALCLLAYECCIRRPSLPADHPVFSAFNNPAPLLIIGSQSWNDTNVKSYIRTAKDREALVLEAAGRLVQYGLPGPHFRTFERYYIDEYLSKFYPNKAGACLAVVIPLEEV